jgi:uncharacterized repeat protein (TIGR02543 family)
MRKLKLVLLLLFYITLMGFADTIPFSGSSTSALNTDWTTGSTFTLYCHDGVWDGQEKVVNAYTLGIGDNTVSIVSSFLAPYDDVYWDGDSYDVQVDMWSFDVELMPVTQYGNLTISFDGTENETQVSQYFVGQAWSCGGSFGAASTWDLTINNTYPARGSVKVDGVTYTAPLTDIADGETRAIQAYPATGYEFDAWSGDLVSENNPDTITMDDDKTVTVSWDSKTPTITSVSPNRLYGNATYILTITGTNFQEGCGVSFGPSMTVNHSWGSGTTIYASVTTSYVKGAYTLTVTNYNTTKTATKNFAVRVSSIKYTPILTPSLTATGVSATDIILTITQTTQAGNPVNGYRFEWQNPNGTDWAVLTADTNSETISYSAKALHMDDLTSSETYRFVCYAIDNQQILSAPSNEAVGYTFPPYAPSPAPTGLTEVSTTDTAIFLSWTAPDYSPSGDMPAVSAYLISATDMSVVDGQTYQVNTESDAVTGSITGLDKTTQYMVTVAAINSAGTGNASEYILSSTTGESRYTVTINELNDLVSVIFFVFSDSNRTDTEIVLYTNASGQDTAYLLDGTYYYTAIRDGYSDKQDSFTVDGEALQVDFTMTEAITIRKDSFFQFLLQ